MKVFINYSDEDLEIAEQLYGDLKSAGIIPWMSSKNKVPGKNKEVSIREAVRENTYFFVLRSSKSLKQGYFNKELKIALDKRDEFPKNKIFIIPVRIDKCVLFLFDERLETLECVDLFPSYENGLKKILQFLRHPPENNDENETEIRAEVENKPSGNNENEAKVNTWRMIVFGFIFILLTSLFLGKVWTKHFSDKIITKKEKNLQAVYDYKASQANQDFDHRKDNPKGTGQAYIEEEFEFVTVWGEALIYDKNLQQAKDHALQEAFSTAIAQIMGSFITAEIYTRYYDSIERSVLSKTREYVRTYKILKELTEGELLRVQVTISISKAVIKDDLAVLGILLDTMGNPVVEITGNDEGLDVPESIPAFKRILSAKGFYLLDQSQGKLSDVIIQLSGKITNRSIIDNTGFYGNMVELKAKAVQRSTKKIIASKNIVGNGAGLSETAALKQAYQQAAESLSSGLIELISEKWEEELRNGRMLSLIVKADDYNKIQGFTKYMGRVFGVKKADMKYFQNGEARYSVRFAGRAETLTELILKGTLGDFNISVKSFDSNSIELSVN